ncbi:MAG: UDP-2,3-diacylglucosamine diphosphatase LpxI [Magnetococcus sp. XQGC-1]
MSLISPQPQREVGATGRERVGLIAGSGSLPLLLAHHVGGVLGHPLVVAAHEGETSPAIEQQADQVLWVKLGRFKRILNFFKHHQVQWVVLAGGITKTAIWRVRPDALALRMVLRLRHLHDDLLLRAVASELEAWGFQVKSVVALVPELLATAGVLSQRQPDPQHWDDLILGWQAAQTLGSLDIGQGVVVKRKVVVAVEAIEGTDAMIQRAGALIRGHSRAGGGDAVMVKICKPQQDKRLDLPTVGPQTLENLHKAGIAVLAIEAGGTLVLDPEVTIRLANRNKQVFVACTRAQMENASCGYGPLF